VINKADRRGVEETRRDLELMLDLSHLIDWRPPIIAAVATEATGVGELWNAITDHRAHLEKAGLMEQRREQRMRRELRQIVATRVDARARELCTGRSYEELEEAVLARSVDPWTAADRLLTAVGA
jgi:LAO/AO transport system kinase